MAAFQKYSNFAKDCLEKKHDFSADTFKLALSNRTPIPATDNTLTQFSEIAAGNGYPAGGETIVITNVVINGAVTEVQVNELIDIVFAATGGAFPPFRYTALYNATNGLLVSFYDRGSELNLQDGETYTADTPSVLFNLG